MGMWRLIGTVSSKKDLELQGNKAEKAIVWRLGGLVMLKRKKNTSKEVKREFKMLKETENQWIIED